MATSFSSRMMHVLWLLLWLWLWHVAGIPCACLQSPPPPPPPQHASQAPVDPWYHMTLHHLVCAARAQKHEEQPRLCSPESLVSRRYQAARWCARFTTHGLGWEGACRVWSLRRFVALYARILILHTENVRHRGGQQQRKQIVACAGACEFVARLWGDSRGNQHGGQYRPRASNVTCQSRSFLLSGR